MQKLFTLVMVILVCSWAQAELKPLSQSDKNFYRQVLSDASYSEGAFIDDPIPPQKNKELLKIYDSTKSFMGYVREVATHTGCEGLCKLLDFTLVYGVDRNFLKLIVRDPLTKDAHEEFSDEDYEKLHSILIQPPQSYYGFQEPKDLVDAVTGATKPELQSEVVPTAAYTSFRTFQYNEQTKSHLSAE